MTNWHLPEVTGWESLESLEALGEILANEPVVLAVSRWVRNMLLGCHLRLTIRLYNNVDAPSNKLFWKLIRHCMGRILQLDHTFR